MNPHVEVEIARRYLCEYHQSFEGRDIAVIRNNHWSIRVNQHDAKDAVIAWNNIPTRILTASPHLQGYDVPGAEIDRLKAQGLTLLEALEELGID